VRHLNALLSALNIPAVTDKLFKRHERFVGPAIENLAHQTCVDSIRLEKELTLKDRNPTKYGYLFYAPYIYMLKFILFLHQRLNAIRDS